MKSSNNLHPYALNIKVFLSAVLILSVSFALHQPMNHQVNSASHSLTKTKSAYANTPHPFIDLKNFYFPISNAHSDLPEFAALAHNIEQFMQHWELKGASLAIVKDGRLVYAKGFGYADQEKNIKTQPYHTFRMASVSKLFTAVGIMKLAEEGKLKLKDKVFGKEGILNDSIFLHIKDPLAYKINVWHLLTHTGGWRNQLRRDPMFSPVAVADIMQVPSPPSLESTMRFMLAQQGFFEPGTLYDYSNFGYCVLGKIIEKVTGQSYESYMQKEILHPLNITRMRMTSNHYEEKTPQEVRYYPHTKAPLNISCYGKKDSVSRAYEGTNTQGLSAAGGWIATPIDVLKFLNAIDGRPLPDDILHEGTVKFMTTPYAQDSTAKYIIGWKSADQEKWWRTGSLTGTSASLVRRKDGLSWFFVTNSDTWRGPYFTYEIEGMMRRAIKSIKKWPEYDLFVLNP